MGTMNVTNFSSVPYCRISGLPFHSKTWQMLLPCRLSHRVIEAHWTSSWSLIQLKDHIHANPLFCVIFNLVCIVNLQNITICAKDSSVQKRANKTMKRPTETTKTEKNGKKQPTPTISFIFLFVSVCIFFRISFAFVFLSVCTVTIWIPD